MAVAVADAPTIEERHVSGMFRFERSWPYKLNAYVLSSEFPAVCLARGYPALF